MQFIPTWKTSAAMLAMLLVGSALTSPAFAKPRKAAQPVAAAVAHDDRYPAQTAPAHGGAPVSRGGRRAASPTDISSRAVAFGGSDLVSEARRWIGTNPTDMSNLWCARFMNFVLERTGRRGTGSNMASSFASYGRRVSGPQIGAIAVMSRGKSGGHVGVVSGIDEGGNPIVISGNHGKRVAEATYPRSRIYAYVMP